MAVANRITGKNVVITFGGVDIRPDFTSFTVNESIDTVDVTAANEVSRYYIPTIRDASMTLEAFFDGTTETVWDAVVPGTAGTLILGPSGTAATSLKYTWERVIATGRDVRYPFDEAVTLTVNFQASGACTEGTY